MTYRSSGSGYVSYTVNADNQATSATAYPSGSRTYGYDAAGNVQTDSFTGRTYGYDWQNRLTQISEGSTTHAFQYDPFGRRVLESATQGGLTSTNLLYYAGSDVVVETDSSGTVTREALFGPGVDRLEYLKVGTTTHRFPLEDARGSILNVVDEQGSTTTTFSYSAFGETTRTSGEAFPYAFSGRRYLESLKLYDYRHRFYDPWLGRFLQRDPIGIWGDGVGLGNGYAYVGNNPISRVDPFGLGGVDTSIEVCPFGRPDLAVPLDGSGSTSPNGGWSVCQPQPKEPITAVGPPCRDTGWEMSEIPPEDPPEPVPVDEEDCPRRYTSGWSRFWRCVKGGGQMVVGMGVAVASFETGVGFWAGILVAGRGLDNVVAGVAGDRPVGEKLAGQVYMGFGLDPNQAQRAGDFTGDLADLALGSVARGAQDAQAREFPDVIYREGRPSPSNLTPRPNDDGILSFRDSLSNPVEPGTPGPLGGRPVFRPGEPWFGVDTSKLPPGSIVVDDTPVGHVGVRGVPAQALKDAVTARGKF